MEFRKGTRKKKEIISLHKLGIRKGGGKTYRAILGEGGGGNVP